MEFIEIMKAIILGIIEGITEWLPVSSTGHMILVDEFLQLNMSPAFKEMFFVVIQLGAIMAVVVLYWKKIFPFSFKKKPFVQKSIIIMWIKVIIACLPAAVIGLLFDDKVNELFYNFQTVAIMLILFGIFFIVVENYNKGKNPIANDMDQLTFKMAVIIPSYSRSFPRNFTFWSDNIRCFINRSIKRSSSRIYILPSNTSYVRS